MGVVHIASTTERARQAARPAHEERPHLPVDVLPPEGLDAEEAYDLITGALLLDGSARRNLATFVTTSMPQRAAVLMAETADNNIIDKGEYPATAEIESRRGWLVPADTYPANREDPAVLRIVVRAGMRYDMADHLLDDLRPRTADLEPLDRPLPRGATSEERAFAH